MHGTLCVAQTATTVFSVGGANSADDEWFHSVRYVDVAQNGWVCIGDSGRLEVLCYSSDGALQVSMGGDGDGPGEFRTLSAMEVDTIITVWDAVTGRATQYSLKGHILDGKRTGPDWLMAGSTRRLRHDSWVSSTAARYSHGEWYDPYYQLIVSRVDSPPDTIASIRSGAAFWYGAANGYPYSSVSTPFGSGGAWTFLGDSMLVVADGYSGDLTWYEAGPSGLTVVYQTAVLVDVRPISDKHMEVVERTIRANFDDVPREVVLRGPPSWSGISTLIHDDAENVLYIGSPAEDGGMSWRALYADGSLNSVPLPSGFDLKTVSNGVYYGVVADDLDVQQVVGLRFGSGLQHDEIGAVDGS